mmetsp:Transcript_12225/g.27692  ORF Transcript_12225/g.27692 Transcript_12225/m.27692 type:complete len:281 (+) Transcript_12225:104-946(+)
MDQLHRWKRGEKVLYYSETSNDWIETTVVAIFNDSVQVDCKPGLWITPAEQPFKLRALDAAAAPAPQAASPNKKGVAAPRTGSNASEGSGPRVQKETSEKSSESTRAKLKDKSKELAAAGRDLVHSALGMFKKGDKDANSAPYWSRDLCRPVDAKLLPFVQQHVTSADPAAVSSVNIAITRLHESSLSAPSGLILVYSAAQDYWWLLFQSDKQEVAEATIRHAGRQREIALRALEPELQRAGLYHDGEGVVPSPTARRGGGGSPVEERRTAVPPVKQIVT